MKESRWLLPFSQGIDDHAIKTALGMAKAQRARLLPVSLISSIADEHDAEKRLEYLRRAKDFIELTGALAASQHIPIECHEVFTLDVGSCLPRLIHDVCADAIIIVVCEGQGRLLSTDEVKRVVLSPPAPLVLIRLQETPGLRSMTHSLSKFFSLLHRKRRADEVGQVQHIPITSASPFHNSLMTVYLQEQRSR